MYKPDEFRGHPLKKISTGELEYHISKSIKEATSVKYDVNIKEIIYESEEFPENEDILEFRIRITKSYFQDREISQPAGGGDG